MVSRMEAGGLQAGCMESRAAKYPSTIRTSIQTMSIYCMCLWEGQGQRADFYNWIIAGAASCLYHAIAAPHTVAGSLILYQHGGGGPFILNITKKRFWPIVAEPALEGATLFWLMWLRLKLQLRRSPTEK
jgi:hypothetical protein